MLNNKIITAHFNEEAYSVARFPVQTMGGDDIKKQSRKIYETPKTFFQ